MLNMGKMMKQVQDMQSKMGQMQAALEAAEFAGQSASGLVVVTLGGKGDMKKVKIDPKAVDPSDIEMMEDLIVAAFNDAKAKLDAHIATETEKAMGGLKLPPGMQLPF
jgi:DNA-binding YbaB/EbfC family protein